MPVSSGYRNPIHNEEVGGKSESRHMYGDAVDIRLQVGMGMEIYIMMIGNLCMILQKKKELPILIQN
ncbi:MAG TPA: D-Ala-D-Ala carboxypeptidase family metallohydrolase [bacterium]|nr:D-Ala-D-Ala carboxypeptidase family metallohydrolase [bacterium]